MKKGFTLIELLVAMSIFIIVIMVVLGLFTTAIKAQRKAFAMQNAQENARFVMEFMAKEIRMSTINSSTESTLSITRSDGSTVTYAIIGGKIERTSPLSSGSISSEEVYITGSFYTEGVGSEDGLQPKLTIALKIETLSVKAEERTKINIQTTLCQRNLDL
jgi:Tfp pilus assembly protein PilW